MRTYLIVNADDFGYSYGINKGIVEAHTHGIVTSTSVLVDGIAANEAKDLVQFPDLSIGLHLELKDLTDVAAELDRQIAKFVTTVGRQPDHIDTHKRHTTDPGIYEVLRAYTDAHHIPVRNFSAKHIGSYGVNTGDTSLEQLKRSVEEATDEWNELMTHVGYADDYLREHSTYSDPREEELRTICSAEIKTYLQDKDIQLASWKISRP